MHKIEFFQIQENCTVHELITFFGSPWGKKHNMDF